MKHKHRHLLIIIFLLAPTFACQLVDSVLREPSATADPAPQPTQLADSNTESTTVPPTEPAATESPPPLPPTIANNTENGASGFTRYQSPAGYDFDIPTAWTVSDQFGQTIVTNDPAVLKTGEISSNQLLMLFISGSVSDYPDGSSAETLLDTLQNDILAGYLTSEGALTALSDPEPAVSPDASGVQATYRLTGGKNPLFVRSQILIRQDLYVLFIGMIPEANQDKLDGTVSQVADSLTLSAEAYLVDTDTYQLSAAEVQAIDTELGAAVPLPASAQEIDFGETAATVGPNKAAVFQFTAESNTAITLMLTPEEGSFDPILDLIDSDGRSILPAVIDAGGQGEIESIENLTLPAAGEYRIVVRGFGFSSGPFTMALNPAE